MDVYEALIEERSAGRPCALATIVNVVGSIPSHAMAKMLVRRDGSIAGTVGGGVDFLKPGRVSLKNRALSGSGHEVKGAHIYDPRLRQVKSRQLAVWVSHPSPALSDGLSTAFMVMDLKEIEAAAADRPEIWTLVVGRDKNCYWFNRPADFSQDI